MAVQLPVSSRGPVVSAVSSSAAAVCALLCTVEACLAGMESCAPMAQHSCTSCSGACCGRSHAVFNHIQSHAVCTHVCSEFRLSDDMYAQDSIELLKQSGIDFAQASGAGCLPGFSSASTSVVRLCC